MACESPGCLFACGARGGGVKFESSGHRNPGRGWGASVFGFRLYLDPKTL